MMDLRDIETHYLVQQGLKQLRNPFLKGMAGKNSYSLGSEITPIGVTFYITPLINSITRVGTMEEKTLLFESMLEWKAYDMIPSTKRGCKGQKESRLDQSVRTCVNVKSRQTKEQDKAVAQVKNKIVEDNLLDHQILLIKLEQADFNKGITGLIANKIMAEYQKPTLLLSKHEQDGKIFWSGSGRSPGSCGLNDFRSFCEGSYLIEFAQGHPQAFGFSMPDETVNQFLEYSDEALKDVTFSPQYKVDFVYDASSVSSKDILQLGDFKHLWGQCLNEPLLAVENLAITKDMLTLMSRDKSPTLKIQLSNGISCIKFKSSEEELNKLYSRDGCVTVNLVGTAQVNRYRDSVTPQILIQDYEIINRQDYYF